MEKAQEMLDSELAHLAEVNRTQVMINLRNRPRKSFKTNFPPKNPNDDPFGFILMVF